MKLEGFLQLPSPQDGALTFLWQVRAGRCISKTEFSTGIKTITEQNQQFNKWFKLNKHEQSSEQQNIIHFAFTSTSSFLSWSCFSSRITMTILSTAINIELVNIFPNVASEIFPWDKSHENSLWWQDLGHFSILPEISFHSYEKTVSTRLVRELKVYICIHYARASRAKLEKIGK